MNITEERTSSMKDINPRSIVQSMPMFRVALLFVLGIVIGDYAGDCIDFRGWLIAICAITGLAILTDKVNERLCSLLILAGCCVMGCLRISYDADSGRYIKKDCSRYCELAIISEPVIRGKVIMFDCVETGNGDKLRCSILRDTITRRYESVHIGDGIKGVVDLTPLKNWHRVNAHFDYIKWLQTRGFVGRGFFSIGKWEKEEVGWRDMKLRDYVLMKLLVAREHIMHDMRMTHMDAEAFAVGTAMAFGNKAALTPELRDEYGVAGASHILALSGMHLSIIYMILSFLAGRRSKKHGIAIGMLAVVWAYVLFVGMPLSVVRAACMLTLWEFIKMIGRDQHELNVFGLTLFLMVVVSPQSIWDVGFQMSFCAVLAITVFMKPLNKIMPKKIRPLNKKQKRKMRKRDVRIYTILRGMWYTCTISCSAQLGTMPLMMYYFGRMAMYFVVTNIVVIPLASIVICGMLAFGALVSINMMMGGALWTMVKGFGIMVGGVIGFQNWMIKMIGNIPGSSIEGIDVSGIQVLGMYIIIVGIAVFVNRERE